MNLVWVGSSGVALAGGLLSQAVQGPGDSLQGIAAIVSASAGLLAAVTALVLGLRSRRSISDEARVEVLMELLREQLDERRTQEGPET